MITCHNDLMIRWDRIEIILIAQLRSYALVQSLSKKKHQIWYVQLCNRQSFSPVARPLAFQIVFKINVLFVQLVLDSQKRVFSWGFGGYGRLGHAEQKDEMVPRLVKLFDFPGRGASQICSGYQCSFAVSEMGKRIVWVKWLFNIWRLLQSL